MQKESKLTEVQKILSSEAKLGILFSLQFYDSLNLKQIADIAGMKEPSAFEHIKGRRNEKGLLEMNLIEEDNSQEGRGKYYKLTDAAKEVLRSINAGIKGDIDENTINNEIAELINYKDERNLQIIAEFFGNIAITAKNFASYTANFVKKQINQSDNEIQGKLENNIYINFSHLHIKTIEQKRKLIDICSQLGKVIHEISEESKNKTEGEIDEKYFFYTFLTSLTLIDPRNQ